MTIIQFAREVAEYLISLGHKQIAFIGGGSVTCNERSFSWYE